ncbi:MAG TPA: extracellular solute-binding protein, partial [Steroidobacteraceae bacterium]|nr:extracellular solute-binding protein [Steroidobacteraceae bacterium]
MNGCTPNWRARSLSRAAALLGFALVAAACGERHAAAPAPEEQVLNIYNWADYVGYRTITEFERRTGIKVVYQTYDSNQTLEATMLVGHSGYDIVSTTTGFYGHQIKAGAYLPLDKSQLPNWKNLDPEVLAIQAQADPGNRYAVPYLHAMNGFVYNVDLVKAHMPEAPTDSLAMVFDPKVIGHFADCGVTFLDSPEDVIQLALAYLHLDPNSRRVEDLYAAERVVMAVRPYIRTFDSNGYWHQLASNEICVALAWSSDYSVAQA